MAKEKSTSSSSRDKSGSSKKEKKDKSLSKQTSDGISKSKSKSKSSKHSSSNSVTPENADRLLQEITSNSQTLAPEADASADADADESMLDISNEKQAAAPKPLVALVPFANPLADEKVAKKVFKTVKKANKAKALKRGVKEVVKTLRKSSATSTAPIASSTASSSALPASIVIIAADISPMDVISHLPVLCEDHGVPYIFVSSRAELGAAGMTKRPTSVVLVGRTAAAKKAAKGKEGEKGEKDDMVQEKDGGGAGEWEEVYADLVKVVRKAGRGVRI